MKFYCTHQPLQFQQGTHFKLSIKHVLPASYQVNLLHFERLKIDRTKTLIRMP